MNMLHQRLVIEWGHFQALGEGLRRMLISYMFYLMATPLLGIFLNTFLWRQGGGVLHVALYNLFWLFGLPVGFLINGFLLRRFHTKHVSFFGTVLVGMGSLLAIFSGVLTPLSVSGYGLVYGIFSGLFWSNRNILDFLLSRGKNRGYYTHLYYVVELLISVVMPTLVGWLLVAGEGFGWYHADSAYKVLMVVAFGFLAISGWCIASFPMPAVTPQQLFLRTVSKRWKTVRLYNFIYNLQWGINFFLPAVLILHFGSKEGVLGTMESIAAILAAGGLYILGRTSHSRYAVRNLMAANLLYLAGSLFLLWQFSWIGAAVYLITVVISSPVRFGAGYPVIMDVMDREDGVTDGKTDYAHVFDNEIFFNLGRCVAILSLLVAMHFSLEGALKWIPVIMAFSQFMLIKLLKNLVKEVSLLHV